MTLLALLLLFGTVFGSDVIELSFEDDAPSWRLDDAQIALVHFYAPWSGHCKALLPQFEKAATELRGEVNLVRVDCTSETSKFFCEQHKIWAFPTLMVVRNGGAWLEYTGPRMADAIVEYMREHLKTIDDYEKFMQSDQTGGIDGLFDGAERGEKTDL